MPAWPARGPDPMAGGQHQAFSPGPTPIMATSITGPHSASRKMQHVPLPPTPRPAAEAGSLGGQCAKFCSYRQGINGILLPHPSLELGGG